MITCCTKAYVEGLQPYEDVLTIVKHTSYRMVGRRDVYKTTYEKVYKSIPSVKNTQLEIEFDYE